MRYLISAPGFVLVLVITAIQPVHAGPYTDSLSKCLVRSTTMEDKNNLIKWIFGAMAAHPEVSTMAQISREQGEQLNRQAAGLLTTLLTDRCRSETQQALQYEGAITIQKSFSVLGAVAMRGLMSHPDVNHYIGGLDRHLDKKKLEGLQKKEKNN